MTIIKNGKVSTHTQSYKGNKIKYPRITVTGKKLQDAGFEIGDPIVVKEDGKGRLIIEREEIKTSEK